MTPKEIREAMAKGMLESVMLNALRIVEIRMKLYGGTVEEHLENLKRELSGGAR